MENVSNEFPDNFLPGFHVLFSGGGLKTFLKLWNSHKFKMHFYIFEIANLPCDSQDLMVLLAPHLVRKYIIPGLRSCPLNSSETCRPASNCRHGYKCTKKHELSGNETI